MEAAASLASTGAISSASTVLNFWHAGLPLQAGILAGDIEGGLEVMDGSFVQQLHSRTTGLSAFEAV